MVKTVHTMYLFMFWKCNNNKRHTKLIFHNPSIFMFCKNNEQIKNCSLICLDLFVFHLCWSLQMKHASNVWT